MVEQLIRPTGLVDPEIEVRKAGTQVDDLLDEIRQRVAANERVLVTCLTKKMAEDLTDYYHDLGVRVRYLHSDIETIERVEIIRSLRKGDFDVLVGINLLREGLDLPEVSLVAILDADKEGFLRSARSLIQTIGRAARNLNGKVIMYADTHHRLDAHGDRRDRSPPRQAARIQRGARHHARRPSSRRSTRRWSRCIRPNGRWCRRSRSRTRPTKDDTVPPHELPDRISELRREMMDAAEKLDYERAAELRDRSSGSSGRCSGWIERRRAGAAAGAARRRARTPAIGARTAGRPQGQGSGKCSPAKSRGRKGAGAATGAAAGAAGAKIRSSRAASEADPRQSEVISAVIQQSRNYFLCRFFCVITTAPLAMTQ